MNKIRWVNTTRYGAAVNTLYEEWHLTVDGEYQKCWLLRADKNPERQTNKRYNYFCYIYDPDADDEQDVIEQSTPLAVTNMKDAKAAAYAIARLT